MTYGLAICFDPGDGGATLWPPRVRGALPWCTWSFLTVPPQVNGYLGFAPYSSCCVVSSAVTQRLEASFVLPCVIMIFRKIVDVLNQSAMPAAARTFCIYDNYPSSPLPVPAALSALPPERHTPGEY
ncbi:hypothetical protein E2C01_040367 [Portunus trituberculatus]|uniref:Uncharacterized protein n=1 Tax=Portunus trituberculatus TaxID=210409 RepID=A0A5B7FNK6_PORTR|nr:hypothetical protein [Portunus trituberculatus]